MLTVSSASFFPPHFHFLTFFVYKTKRATHSATSYIFSTWGPEGIPVCLSKLKYIYYSLRSFTACPRSLEQICGLLTKNHRSSCEYFIPERLLVGRGLEGGSVFFLIAQYFWTPTWWRWARPKEFPVTEERSASCWRSTHVSAEHQSSCQQKIQKSNTSKYSAILSNPRLLQPEVWISQWSSGGFQFLFKQVCQTFALALLEMRHVFINSARVSEGSGETLCLPELSNVNLSENRALNLLIRTRALSMKVI